MILILILTAHFAYADTCQFYECPYGEVVWLENGGVTFAKTNTKDCKLMGQGDEKAAREFEVKNQGKHLMFDCKKEKKK